MHSRISVGFVISTTTIIFQFLDRVTRKICGAQLGGRGARLGHAAQLFAAAQRGVDEGLRQEAFGA